jgi:hypothetical protein
MADLTTAVCPSSTRSRSGELVAVASTMTALAVAFAGARLICRRCVVTSSLCLDDWLALAATGSIIASAFLNIYGLAGHGMGQDIWTLSPGEITAVLRYFHAIAWMYFLDTALIKLSVIGFYLRIFPSTAVRRLLWGSFTVTCAWGATFVLVAIFQCRPVEYFLEALGWDASGLLCGCECGGLGGGRDQYRLGSVASGRTAVAVAHTADASEEEDRSFTHVLRRDLVSRPGPVARLVTDTIASPSSVPFDCIRSSASRRPQT